MSQYNFEKYAANMMPLGIVFISPAGRVEKQYSAPHKALAKVVAKVAPGVGVARFKSEFMSRDPVEQKKYSDDQLVIHSAIRADTASAMLKTLEKLDFSLLKCPILILHAGRHI